MRLFDAWVLSRLVSGQSCDEFIDATHPRFRPVARYLAETDRSSRSNAFGCYLAGQCDRDEVFKAVADADPLGPAPSLTDDRRPASALDLDQAAFGVQWAWPGWIPRGRVCGVGGFEGTGKTRFALDLARAAYHGLPWPDGQSMTLPPGSKSLWICGDGHQEEIAGAARKMNLPLDAILFNASPEDPCTGVDLDDPAAIESLDAFLEISAAPLVFIDTLTNSTSRDLCRQNDVKSLLSPLQEIAQRRQVAIALLLHLSQAGQALGRRTKGLTRTLIHLDCPDPDQPTRLRLWVEKSFDVRPHALGVTIGEAGNEYDDGPRRGQAVERRLHTASAARSPSSSTRARIGSPSSSTSNRHASRTFAHGPLLPAMCPTRSTRLPRDLSSRIRGRRPEMVETARSVRSTFCLYCSIPGMAKETIETRETIRTNWTAHGRA